MPAPKASSASDDELVVLVVETRYTKPTLPMVVPVRLLHGYQKIMDRVVAADPGAAAKWQILFVGERHDTVSAFVDHLHGKNSVSPPDHRAIENMAKPVRDGPTYFNCERHAVADEFRHIFAVYEFGRKWGVAGLQNAPLPLLQARFRPTDFNFIRASLLIQMWKGPLPYGKMIVADYYALDYHTQWYTSPFKFDPDADELHELEGFIEAVEDSRSAGIATGGPSRIARAEQFHYRSLFYVDEPGKDQ